VTDSPPAAKGLYPHEAASLCGVSDETIRRWCKLGAPLYGPDGKPLTGPDGRPRTLRLPHSRMGRHYRIDPDDLAKFRAELKRLTSG
jgi:hypothetical protein